MSELGEESILGAFQEVRLALWESLSGHNFQILLVSQHFVLARSIVIRAKVTVIKMIAEIAAQMYFQLCL